MPGARKSPRSAATWSNSAAALRERCTPSSRTSKSAWAETAARPWGVRSVLLADVADRLRRFAFWRLAQADHAFALQLHAVAAHEGFLTIGRQHESAIGALVDQQELAAADLYTRMDAGD